MTEQLEMMPAQTESESLGLIGRDIGDVPEDRWAQALVDMVRVQEAVYLRQGRGEYEAFVLARDGVLALAEYFGARMWYLPRGDRLRTALRDAEIYRQAKRGNIRQLADEHRLSEQQVYRIIRQQRALHLNKIQGRLFDD
ncbi:Mor transcription activator family protein [Vulcaniibacterium tengchongense]|uniref:Mor transcription activator family protein n=1 Tax=Vulcaniibacterium tengchongense TaxID=1273429 RepID=UPI000F50F4DC|nr:Mor transcription activator family protein [Vulcaniibacterium tengchongense]